MLEMNDSALQINVSEIQRPEAAEASASEPRQFEVGVAAGPLLGAVAVGRKQPLGAVGFEDRLVGLLVGRRCGEFDAVGQLVVGDVDAGAVLQQLPKRAEFVPERDFGEPFAASVGLELLDIPRREVADGFDFVGLTPANEKFELAAVARDGPGGAVQRGPVEPSIRGLTRRELGRVAHSESLQLLYRSRNSSRTASGGAENRDIATPCWQQPAVLVVAD